MTAPVSTEPEPPKALEGAGVFSSVDDLGTAVHSGDGFEIAFAGLGVALDGLGFVVDPFGALLEAGAGWLMEHVWFLSEPMGVLAGDPNEVKAQAQSWHRVSVELSAIAAAQRGLAVTGPVPWTGEAAEAYRQAVEQRAARMSETAEQVDRFATLLITSAAGVGTVRSIVRDLIAEFIADVVEWILLGSLLSLLTSGVSLAASIGWVIVDATLLAGRIAERIARLLETMAEAGHAAGGLAAGVLQAARWTGETAGAVRAGAVPVDALVEGREVASVVELGKQSTTAELAGPPPAS
ncbi:WXG100 family type VII secretion target [Pseudonocardia humida]|uniref:PPE family protein n=1 Tax=Pseudonocardia humida TaxID=2800819 RepID=A0ABT1A3E1_9PSEU|nr:hypothetical protein [Pseudonocardia humida]MCO1657468.1 hypothetical protein [Pseudonocardia humida]